MSYLRSPGSTEGPKSVLREQRTQEQAQETKLDGIVSKIKVLLGKAESRVTIHPVKQACFVLSNVTSALGQIFQDVASKISKTVKTQGRSAESQGSPTITIGRVPHMNVEQEKWVLYKEVSVGEVVAEKVTETDLETVKDKKEGDTFQLRGEWVVVTKRIGDTVKMRPATKGEIKIAQEKGTIGVDEQIIVEEKGEPITKTKGIFQQLEKNEKLFVDTAVGLLVLLTNPDNVQERTALDNALKKTGTEKKYKELQEANIYQKLIDSKNFDGKSLKDLAKLMQESIETSSSLHQKFQEIKNNPSAEELQEVCDAVVEDKAWQINAELAKKAFVFELLTKDTFEEVNQGKENPIVDPKVLSFWIFTTRYDKMKEPTRELSKETSDNSFYSSIAARDNTLYKTLGKHSPEEAPMLLQRWRNEKDEKIKNRLSEIIFGLCLKNSKKMGKKVSEYRDAWSPAFTNQLEKGLGILGKKEIKNYHFSLRELNELTMMKDQLNKFEEFIVDANIKEKIEQFHSWYNEVES